MDSPNQNSYLTANDVRRRFGNVSDMTIWRWEQDRGTGFPEPMRINRRRYWRVADLDAWETWLRTSREAA